jgi:AcrR family transcriptional regulator
MTASRTRERIVEAAAGLLAAGGPEAMTTRAVSAAAGVQAPAIYRLFDDKHGLLDAVTSHVFAGYLHSKASMPRGEDPVDDLRRGWDLHVGFGLAHPAVYAAIYGSPRPGAETPAERQAAEILAGLVHRIARAGRLALTEQAAAQLVHATGRGTTLTLIGLPPERRDPELAILARESAIAAVTTPAGPTAGRPAPAVAAVTLRALLPEVTELTEAERHLMAEWLNRIATP